MTQSDLGLTSQAWYNVRMHHGCRPVLTGQWHALDRFLLCVQCASLIFFFFFALRTGLGTLSLKGLFMFFEFSISLPLWQRLAVLGYSIAA